MMKHIQAFTKFFVMIKGPTNLASIFPPFLACKILFEDLATHLVHFRIGMFPIIQLFLFSLGHFDVSFASLSHCRCSAAICSTSNGNSSPTFRTLFRQSSAASLHISMSIVRVAFLPNISSKGIKQVDSCQDVLYAKPHVSKNSSHWLFFFAANLTSMF